MKHPPGIALAADSQSKTTMATHHDDSGIGKKHDDAALTTDLFTA